MAPEQVAGLAEDERTDVYALGLVGWEMLAGRRPWQGETLYGVLHKQQHEPLPALAALRPDIPAYLLAAIEGATAKAPDGRWRDGAAFLARLTPTPARLPPLADPEAADESGATVRFAAPRGARPAAVRSRTPGMRRLAVGLVAVVVGAVGVRLATGRTEAGTAPAGGRVVAADAGALARVGPAVPRPRVDARARARASTAAVAADARHPAPRPDRVSGDVTAEARRLAAADARADARAAAAYDALLFAIRRSAGGGREPRAARALQDEQRLWRARRDADCRRSAAGATDPASAAAACRSTASDDRTRALTVRRARFDPDPADGVARGPGIQ